MIVLLENLHRYGEIRFGQQLTRATTLVALLRQPARRIQQNVGVNEAHFTSQLSIRTGVVFEYGGRPRLVTVIQLFARQVVRHTQAHAARIEVLECLLQQPAPAFEVRVSSLPL